MFLLKKILSEPVESPESINDRPIILEDAESLLDHATITDSALKEPMKVTSIEEHKGDILLDLLEDTLFFIEQHRIKTRGSAAESEINLVEDRLNKQLDCFAAYGETAKSFLYDQLKESNKQQSKSIKTILYMLEDE